MRNIDAFSGCHPAVCFLYFGLVLLFSMAFMDPLCLAFSFLAALGYALYLKGRGALRFLLRVPLPVMLLAAALNPAFSHEGATILGYLPSGNPLTKESVLFGLAAAVMLGAVLLWFFCYAELVPSDKFLCFFGRVFPAASLLLSMTLRFVPRFHRQLLRVRAARRGLGLEERGRLARLRGAVKALSMVVTWSLENAVDSADSMRARGYGMPGRTSADLYRFDGRDRALCRWLGFCGAYILAGWAAGGLRFRYYPVLSGGSGAFPLSFRLCFLALCLTPLFLDLWEDGTWKRLRSGS